MKNIDTLVEDIYHALDSDHQHETNEVLATKYAIQISVELTKATDQRTDAREKGRLWASDLGKPCLRQHWYNFNDNPTKEKLDGHTKFKFLYGNILEESVLYLAEEAGHDVSHCQARVETQVGDWTISGRIDGVVDGHLLDVKSTSTYGFKRYKEGINAVNDSFGYRFQLGFYKSFGDFDVPIVDSGFLWIDKGNGHLLYTQVDDLPTKAELISRAQDIIEAVDKDEQMVPRAYGPTAYGKSGNMSLPMACSYCPHKQQCWRDSNNGQGLRGFVYNQGPVWFTDVAREPKCPEIKERSDE